MELALSTKAKIAAAALTAATIIGGAFTASAQQMALGGPDMTACDKLSLTAPARAIQCRVDAVKAHGAAARQEASAVDKEGQCVDRLKAEIASGRVTADAVRTRLAGRKILEVGACNLLGNLTRS